MYNMHVRGVHAVSLCRIGSFLFSADFDVPFFRRSRPPKRDFPPKSGSVRREIGTGVPRRLPTYNIEVQCRAWRLYYIHTHCYCYFNMRPTICCCWYRLLQYALLLLSSSRGGVFPRAKHRYTTAGIPRLPRYDSLMLFENNVSTNIIIYRHTAVHVLQYNIGTIVHNIVFEA